MFGLGESVAVISTALTALKALNENLGALKEASGNVASLGSLLSRFDEVNQSIQEVERTRAGKLSMKEAADLVLAKRQAESFHQRLKERLIMTQGGAKVYRDILNEIERSKLEHEKAVNNLKKARAKRRKQRQEALKLGGVLFCTFAVGMALLFLVLQLLR